MASNSSKTLVPEAKASLEKFKYEVASDMCVKNIFLTPIEVGVNLKNGYNGDISAKDAGRIGGNMVKKLIQQAENNMK